MTNSFEQSLQRQALESSKKTPINLESIKVKEELKSDRFNTMMEEAAVRQYLCDNPDFFVKQPDLLSHIDLAHDKGDVPSLVERQVKTLREKNQSLQNQLVEMLQSAFRNEDLLQNCNRFMLSLLNAKNMDELINKIITGLKKEFELDACALVLIGNYEACHPAKIFSQSEAIKQLLKNQFPESSPLCGRLEKSVKVELFGELAADLNSSALIPLGKNCQFGLLALASKDESRFAPEMGTLFIELIAKTVIGMIRLHKV
ncbi:MAG: DUF484 family protein [Kangiellaceae bacterium]